MKKNRTFDIGKEEFLSYLNDTGETISGYFEILEITQAWVKIKTKGNFIIIPMSRVLKIKLKEDLEKQNGYN
jgi:hypothetical protein